MNTVPVKIYSKEDTPRIRYIAGIIFTNILGLDWDLVTDRRKFGKSPVINYSRENISGSFRIVPDSLLFEKNVSPKHVEVTEWKGLPVFFQISDCDLPFDIFAAAFFLVTRYEEYLEFKPDKYGRFPAAESVAFKYSFLTKPVIDLWSKEFAKALLKKFPFLAFKRNEFRSLLTIDTDQPFAYKGKSILRSIGGMFYDKTKSPVHVNERYRIMSTKEKDPYDVFDYILENIEKNDIESRFFFPVGDRSKYDKNPSWKNAEYQYLIKKISEKFSVGLHPSFVAGGNGSLVSTEAKRLKSVINKEINLSRYHFLRLSMPDSYTKILKAGISEDFSMGYPDEPGFRAGIARPYYFYNVLTDVETLLKITPFQIMDGTLFDYKKLDPDGAKEIILNLITEVRKAGGLFVSIWHNTSLLDNKEWKEWREVFEFMIKSQKP